MKRYPWVLFDPSIVEDITWDIGSKMFAFAKDSAEAAVFCMMGQVTPDNFFGGYMSSFGPTNSSIGTVEDLLKNGNRSSFVCLPLHRSELVPGLDKDWKRAFTTMRALEKSVPEGIPEGWKSQGFMKNNGLRVAYDLVQVLLSTCADIIFI